MTAPLEAERALLGGLLQDPVQLVELGLVVKSEDFYSPHHAALFRLLQVMLGLGRPIDLVSVASEPALIASPDRFGGPAYVAELPEHAPSTANLAYYATIVVDASLRRAVAEVCNNGLVRSDGGESAAGMALELSARLTQIATRTQGKRAVWSFADASAEWASRRIDEEQGAVSAPWTTPFARFNELLTGGGISTTQQVVIGGRPGMGKTGFALAIAADWASKGRPGVFVCEQPRREMVARALQVQGVLSADELAEYDPDDPLILELREKLAPMVFLDVPAASVQAIENAIATCIALNGSCGYVVVDYIQRMKHEKHGGESPNVYIGRTSGQLKELAKKHDTRMLVLAQLNREVEKRSAKKRPADRESWWDSVALPEMSDLRDSGAVEADADLVCFPINGDSYDMDDDKLGALVVSKQRNGRRGVVPLRWQGPCATYRSL